MHFESEQAAIIRDRTQRNRKVPATFMALISHIAAYCTILGLLELTGATERALAQEAPAGEIVRGTASFGDGEPISNTKLDLHLFQAGSTIDPSFENLEGARYFHCHTNEVGQFQLTLPKGAAGILLVVVDQYADGDSLMYHTLRTDFDAQRPRPLELKFENRGKIIVRLFGQAQLPHDYALHLRCWRMQYENIVQMDRQLDPTQRGLVLDGLEPGKYTLELRVPRLGYQTWKTEVTIPAQEPLRSLAKLQIPPIEFGQFAAKFLMPDGITPAANKSFWLRMKEETGSGAGFRTDDQGRLSIEKYPTGKIILYAIDEDGIAPTRFESAVEKNGSATEPKFRLRAYDEVMSWLYGTLQLSDGRPPTHLGYSGFAVGNSLGFYRADNLARTEFQDTTYRIGFEAGLRTLILDMTPLQGGFHLPEPEYLLVNVATEPGQELPLDLVVPAERTAVEVAFPANFFDGDDNKQNLTDTTMQILVPLSDSVTWGTEQSGWSLTESSEVVRFSRIPMKKGYVICLPSRQTGQAGVRIVQHDFGKVRRIDWEQQELQLVRVVLGPEAQAQMQAQMQTQTGKTGLFALPDDPLAEAHEVALWRVWSFPQSEDSQTKSTLEPHYADARPGTATDAAGAPRVSDFHFWLGPGNYRFRIDHEGQSSEKSFRVGSASSPQPLTIEFP